MATRGARYANIRNFNPFALAMTPWEMLSGMVWWNTRFFANTPSGPMSPQANTPLLGLALVLLLALAACDTTVHEEPPAEPAPVARTALAPNALDLAANMTPFDRFRFKGNSHFTHADNAGAVRYKATFRLGKESNGLNPPEEDTHLLIEPNPEFPTTPCGVLFIPAGCFKPGQEGFSVDGLACGVKVLLRDAQGEETDLTPFVSGFRAELAPQGRKWKARVEIDVHTVNLWPTSPCGVTFLAGDDGLDLVPLDSRTRLSGVTAPTN